MGLMGLIIVCALCCMIGASIGALIIGTIAAGKIEDIRREYDRDQYRH